MRWECWKITRRKGLALSPAGLRGAGGLLWLLGDGISFSLAWENFKSPA